MRPEIFGLIGRKLDHSFSSSYFAKKFEELQLNHKYLNFEMESINELPDLISTNKFSGLNVTVPYKESVLSFLDELDPIAEEIGAVNTIEFKEEKLIGHNTDAFGFRQSIKPFLKSNHERALILGSGGASKAVHYVLKEIGVECYTVSRSPEGDQLHYQDLNQEVISTCLLIVNATPVGMYPFPDNQPDIPYRYITDQHLLIDLIYNPEQTGFMKNGRSNGATVLNGLTMLKQQAEKSWSIWNDQ